MSYMEEGKWNPGNGFNTLWLYKPSGTYAAPLWTRQADRPSSIYPDHESDSVPVP